MIRWLQAFSVIAAAGAAVFVFQVKYRAEAVAEQAVQLQRELDQENESQVAAGSRMEPAHPAGARAGASRSGTPSF